MIRLYTIGVSGIFILPVMVPYYKDVIGLNFQEFLIGEAVFSAFVILGEIPTGYLSDIWRRRNVLLLGVLHGIFGFGILLLARDIWMAMLSQAIIGIGLALISGTMDALLYDYLYEQKRESEYRKLCGHRHGLGLFSTALAGIVGAGLYQISPYFPLVMDIVFLIMAAIALLIMREPERHKAGVHHHPVKDMWQTITYALRGHKDIAGIILYSAFLFTGTKMLLWSQQPYYLELAIPEYLFGVLMAAGALMGAAGGQFGHHLDRFLKNREVLGGCSIVVVVAAVLSGGHIGHHGVVLLMLGSFIWGIGLPYVNNAINIRVSSERRATILSTSSFMIHLTFIPVSLFLGFISSAYNIGAMLIILGVFVGLTTTTIRICLWRSKNTLEGYGVYNEIKSPSDQDQR